MAAGEFKAKCLQVMDQVHSTRTPVVITKRGKPIAKLVPAEQSRSSAFDSLKEKLEILGDIVSAVVPLDDRGSSEVILRDTHVLVWMVSDSSRLARDAARELRRAEQKGELAIASITLWELALLHHQGRLRTSGSIVSAIRAILEKSRVQVIEVTPEIAALTTTFPEHYPKDPVDRLTGATA